MEKKSEKQVGTQQKPVNGTQTHDAPPPVDYRSLPLKEMERSSLRNGMLHLDLDIVSAIEQTDDVLLSLSSIGVQTEGLVVKLISVRKHLNKSLHCLRDWQQWLSNESNDQYCAMCCQWVHDITEHFNDKHGKV
jgi:hypothetical protein